MAFAFCRVTWILFKYFVLGCLEQREIGICSCFPPTFFFLVWLWFEREYKNNIQITHSQSQQKEKKDDSKWANGHWKKVERMRDQIHIEILTDDYWTSFWCLLWQCWETSERYEWLLFLMSMAVVWAGGCEGRGEMMTGGMSTVSTSGGGCCQWGSGPARRRFWRRGPASITACRSLPFWGRGFSQAFWQTVGGRSCDNNGSPTIGSVWEDWIVLLSSESEQANILLESLSLCGVISCSWFLFCWINTKCSSINFSHFVSISSFSLMALFRRSFKFIISHSLLKISSFADMIVVSSSKVVYTRACLSSSHPWKIGSIQNKIQKPETESFQKCKMQSVRQWNTHIFVMRAEFPVKRCALILHWWNFSEKFRRNRWRRRLRGDFAIDSGEFLAFLCFFFVCFHFLCDGVFSLTN